MELNEKYYKLTDLILEWNEKINVTAIKDKEEFLNKNVIDSLSIARCKEIENAKKVLDLGTGGGFPGLPLAIAYPDKSFVLVDSVAKKLKVVQDVVDKLGLTNVETIHSRAEDLAKKKELRESFDLVTSRAVANMSTLSEYCLPFVKIGGYFIAYKTAASKEEIDAAKKAIEILGGTIENTVSDGIEGSEHLFVVVKKIKSSPALYPRKAGIPTDFPLS